MDYYEQFTRDSELDLSDSLRTQRTEILNKIKSLARKIAEQDGIVERTRLSLRRLQQEGCKSQVIARMIGEGNEAAKSSHRLKTIVGTLQSGWTKLLRGSPRLGEGDVFEHEGIFRQAVARMVPKMLSYAESFDEFSSGK